MKSRRRTGHRAYITAVNDDPAVLLTKYDYAYEEGWDLRASYMILDQELPGSEEPSPSDISADPENQTESSDPEDPSAVTPPSEEQDQTQYVI